MSDTTTTIDARPAYNDVVKGIFDAIAAGVAANLVNNSGFIDRIIEKITQQETFVTVNDVENHLEAFTDTRNFERIVSDAVEGAVESALSEQELEASDLKGLDDYIDSFISDRVKVTLEVQ